MTVKSAARAVDVIEAFADARRVLTVSELARVMDMPVSSCHGILRTLEECGWLYEPRPRSGYYVTRRLLEMAQMIAAHDPLIERVGPVARALRDRTGETVVFGRLQGGRVLYLLVAESAHSVRYSARAGEWREAHNNSIGKAILGTMAPAARARVLQRLPFKRFTPATLTTARALAADLKRSATRGFYMNVGESLPELMAIAVPITLSGGTFALAVIGPIHRIKPAVHAIAAALRGAVGALRTGVPQLRPGRERRAPDRVGVTGGRKKKKARRA